MKSIHFFSIRTWNMFSSRNNAGSCWMLFLPSVLFNKLIMDTEYFYLTHKRAEILLLVPCFMVVNLLGLLGKFSWCYRKTQFASLVKKELDIYFYHNPAFSFVPVTIDWLLVKRVMSPFFPNSNNIIPMQLYCSGSRATPTPFQSSWPGQGSKNCSGGPWFNLWRVNTQERTDCAPRL